MALEDMAEIYYNKGLIKFRNSDLTSAQKLFQKALILSPAEKDYHNIQGLCLYKLGQFEGAKILWEKSLAITKKDNLAKRYLKALEDKEFQDMYTKYNEAYDLALKKDFKKAIVHINQNKLQDYKIVTINNFYGLCHYASGNTNKAVKIWQGVLKVDSSNPKTLDYLSVTPKNAKGFIGIIKNLRKYLR